MTWHHGDTPGALQLVDRGIADPSTKYIIRTEPAAATNAAAVPAAEHEDRVMKTVEGLAELVAQYRNSDEPGWIMLKDRSSLNDSMALISATFLLGDDEDEERVLQKAYALFLEVPTFQDVITTEAEAGRSSIRDIAEASLYYLDKDTFRD